MSNTFWVLENRQPRGIIYYGGDGKPTTLIEFALRIASKQYAEIQKEHLTRLCVDIEDLEGFVPAEYAIEYKRVVR